MADNITVLTQSHSAIAAKRRTRHTQINEVVFDEQARRVFLTGFHKRKVARREKAKQKAQLREKQERLETRRERRRALAERAARNAAEVERAYGALAGDDGDEWGGVASEREVEEEEYEGAEQVATVTVEEDVDLSVWPVVSKPTKDRAGREQGRVQSAGGDKVKYESRAAEQRKQRARRAEKAGRAGRRRR